MTILTAEDVFDEARLGVINDQTLARHSAAAVIRGAKDREFHSLGLVLGYDYPDSPVVVPDGKPVPLADVVRHF